MASVNPFSGPNSGNKHWVQHISTTLKKQLAIAVDTPPLSIFQIPKILKDINLEAYVPQRIGLGLNHHFHSELYQKKEQNKVTAVKRKHQNCTRNAVGEPEEIVGSRRRRAGAVRQRKSPSPAGRAVAGVAGAGTERRGRWRGVRARRTRSLFALGQDRYYKTDFEKSNRN
ncbi:hypothetical protein LXL04_010795 [Taraxacum kok-saghyz]